MRVVLAFAVLCLSVSSALPAEAPAQQEKPTQTGDPIGTVTMLEDRSLVVQLRSVECDGKIAEAMFKILPGQWNYQPTLDRVGGLKPKETKPWLAGTTPPCPSNGAANALR